MMVDPATTQITTTDTNGGVAIVFTTTRDVNDLRARVHRMADMHNRMSGMHGGPTHEGTQGGGMQHEGMQPQGMGGGGMQHESVHQQQQQQGMGMQHEGMGMEMVPSRATVEDIPGGARLVLVPADPNQLATLRQQARMHADMMQRGQCPMMAPSSPAPEHEMHHPGGA